MSDAVKPTVLTDAKGRKLTLRRLTVRDQAKMLRAIGSVNPQQAQNQPYVQLVECAFMVADIDGVPQPLPSTEAQIDAAFDRLGDEGAAAVMIHRADEINKVMEAAQAAVEAGGSEPNPLSASAPSPTTAPSATPSTSSAAA